MSVHSLVSFIPFLFFASNSHGESGRSNDEDRGRGKETDGKGRNEERRGKTYNRFE